VVAVLLLALSTATSADDRERKSITLISAETSADGLTRVHRELLEECILELPKPDELVPVVTRRAEFLKSINGDPGRNESAQTYSAVIDVGYVVQQKALIIVTTSSIEQQEPIIKEVERRIPNSEQFRSDPNNGDSYAGRDLAHDYYFGTEQTAIEDVKGRAIAWLAQQKTITCAN
jgi:hypothetical protein